MIQDIVIIDDVLDNVEEVLEYAKHLEYYSEEDHPEKGKSYYTGIRSENITKTDQEFSNKLLGHIIAKSLVKTMGYNKEFHVHTQWLAPLYFHQLRQEHVYKDSWWHKDPKLVYAGVVYLNKNAKPEHGTKIITDDKREIEVENKFNRLVLYRSDYMHTPMGGGYGDSIDNCRFTMTFFFQGLNFHLEHPDLRKKDD
jgi:hypothetical protein